MTRFNMAMLRMKARERMILMGISVSPPISDPTITYKADGPMLNSLDGTSRYLTALERFQLWIGWTDAWTLEALDDARRTP